MAKRMPWVVKVVRDSHNGSDFKSIHKLKFETGVLFIGNFGDFKLERQHLK